MRRLLLALALIVALLLPIAPSANAEICMACVHPGPYARVATLPTAAVAPSGNEWHLARIGAQVAWSLGATGKGVRVLVIDTGLDPAVATQVLSGTVGRGWSFDPTLSAHQDLIGHGTFVSSEIGGHGDGYYGVCPDCTVSMARVFGAGEEATDADITRAIRWGIAQHVQVISMSLGSPDYSAPLAVAVADAAKAGILLFCAAGNSGDPAPNYPAANPGCTAVSATDPWDTVTDWSSYGPDVQLAAPGNLISGYLPFGRNAIGGVGFTTISGTSMATPLVAGAAADLLSLGLSPKVALAALLSGARFPPNGHDADHYGHGILDLTGALRSLGYKV